MAEKWEELITFFTEKGVSRGLAITYIIVSGSLFAEFTKKLDKVINEISAVPKIIIFTSETTKRKIETMDIINNSFYNNGGLVIDFCKVLSLKARLHPKNHLCYIVFQDP